MVVCPSLSSPSRPYPSELDGLSCCRYRHVWNIFYRSFALACTGCTLGELALSGQQCRRCCHLCRLLTVLKFCNFVCLLCKTHLEVTAYIDLLIFLISSTNWFWHSKMSMFSPGFDNFLTSLNRILSKGMKNDKPIIKTATYFIRIVAKI